MLISYYFVLGNEFIVTEMTTLDTYAGCSDEKNGGWRIAAGNTV